MRLIFGSVVDIKVDFLQVIVLADSSGSIHMLTVVNADDAGAGESMKGKDLQWWTRGGWLWDIGWRATTFEDGGVRGVGKELRTTHGANVVYW